MVLQGHLALSLCSLYTSTITLQKGGGERKKGKKNPSKNAKPEREEKKEVALFGKASRGTNPGSLVLLTEEGAKAAGTEGGFQG